MTEKIDVAVIGAGVVGLAIAAKFAKSGREVLVLESCDAIGTATSSRNSEVVHAGIYYQPGSQKAELCVRGREMLYEYCQSHGINHKKIGKLIVATDDAEIPAMEQLYQTGIKNGVLDLVILDGDELSKMEPDLKAVGAIYSPSTGLVDSHALMLALQGDIENAGGVIALNSPVVGGRVENGAVVLSIGGAEPMDMVCNTVINSAGHGAWDVAHAIDGVDKKTIPPHHMAKGNYFFLQGRAPFSHLIYPLPGKASLGLHYTLDLGGQGRFGPDVEWVENMDYGVDPDRADSFYASIKNYWPNIPLGSLTPGYSGIRPKVQAQGERPRDFIFAAEPANSLISLYGIESPGLTSCLAIGEKIFEMAS
ncbi:MAG: NAD(P)/FAD-dependent oxidoreductase [Rhodospirillaceae bacterium]|nr:NAD(P)/FAD-dependent oxidoreductase [Rhodospirillaceae bacterium]